MKVLKMKERTKEARPHSKRSQIENEEEEESWQEWDQMAEQWEEEHQLEGNVERRRIDGSS